MKDDDATLVGNTLRHELHQLYRFGRNVPPAKLVDEWREKYGDDQAQDMAAEFEVTPLPPRPGQWVRRMH